MRVIEGMKRAIRGAAKAFDDNPLQGRMVSKLISNRIPGGTNICPLKPT